MRLRSVVLLAGIAAVVAAVLASKALFTADPETTVAEQGANLPFGSAPGAPTPGPTMTPIAPPDDAPLIAEDEARDIALAALGDAARRGARAGYVVVQPEIESAVLLNAGDVPSPGAPPGEESRRFAAWTTNYPLWRVSAAGTFVQPRSIAGVQLPLYTSMVVFVDAVNGTVLGTSMADPVTQ